MQKQGTIVRWDAARAFGFIRSPDTSADVFFHLRDFRGATPPRQGLAVSYDEIHVGGKGPRAMAVQNSHASAPIGASAASRSASPSDRRSNSSSAAQRPERRTTRTTRSQRRGDGRAGTADGALALLLVLGWLGLLGWGIYVQRLPLWGALGAALLINLLTFWIYAADKNAAQDGRWRVPEKNLHLLSLLGGWPGAWLAQQSMRHKSSKREFRVVYWLTVAVHSGALAAWVMGLIAL